MKKICFCIIIFVCFNKNYGQPCNEKSKPNINYCCGHDPEFTSQSNNHRILKNSSAGYENFCHVSKFDLVTINSFASIPGDWMLVWYDDFNYTSFNESFYRPAYAWGPVNGNEIGYGLKQNIYFENGKMKLKAEYKNPSVYDANAPLQNYDYTDAKVSTRMAIPINCRIQSTIKNYPNPYRTWPAFWMFGDDKQEIDIYEFIDNGFYNDENNLTASSSLKMTYHMKKYGYSFMPTEGEGVHHETNTDLSASFNQYDLIWDKWKIHWYFNGNVVHNVSKYYYAPSNWSSNKISKNYRANPMKNFNDVYPNVGKKFMVNQYYPDKWPMQLIISLGLQDSSVVPSDVGPGKSMEVEDLKIWMRASCSNIKTVYSNNYTWLHPQNYFGSIYELGGTVITNIGSNISIPAEHHAIYAAVNEIVLQDGFSAVNGSNFFAYITSCGGAWDYRTKKQVEDSLFLNDDELASVEEPVLNIQTETTFNSDLRNDVELNYNQNSIKINCKTGNIQDVEIYDMRGIIIFSRKNIDNYELEFSKETIAPGIYMSKTTTPGGIDIRKIWILK